VGAAAEGSRRRRWGEGEGEGGEVAVCRGTEPRRGTGGRTNTS
jgi:hypothetical protein